MEQGKVAEWEAPCHQYALMFGKKEENDVSGSDKKSSQIGTNHTVGEKKNNWKVAELEKDQAAFMFFTSGARPYSTSSQVECVLSSWKYREKAGDDSTVRGMLEDMVTKQRFYMEIVLTKKDVIYDNLIICLFVL